MALRAAAALSEHPLAPHAVGECAGQLLEAGGPRPLFVTAFVTAPQLGAVEDITAVLRQLLKPKVLVAAGAVSVLGGSREVEEHGAVSVFAVWADGAAATPVRMAVRPSSDGPEILGADALAGVGGTLVLLADPFTFPVERLLGQLARGSADLAVIGGLASAARAPGGNRLVLDGTVHDAGAVGFLLDAELPVSTVVSQGCRPIGHPLTVTRAEGNLISELAGRPALDRLFEVVEGLDDEDRALAARGLHIGVVVDEHRSDFGPGDFLIRGVLGADRDAGAVAVGDIVEIGTTVQFQVRDASTADQELRAMLAGRQAEGALVFTCNGRGSALFSEPDHDARTVSEALPGAAVGGMFCAGEIGPVGGSNFVHGYTASMALFGSGRPATAPVRAVRDDHGR